MKLTLSPMFAAVAGALALAILPVHAQDVVGDPDAGADKVAMCVGCHGITDYKTAFPQVYRVPKIAGQNAAYLVSSLEGYAKRERKHPSMEGIAHTMSEQDMADVAAYYEQLGKSDADLPEQPRKASSTVAELLSKGGCVACHGENYSTSIDPSYPKLAGQYGDYLFVALKAYKDDSHATWGRGNPIMAAQVKQFSNPELKAIAGYIASLPGEIKTVEGPRFR